MNLDDLRHLNIRDVGNWPLLPKILILFGVFAAIAKRMSDNDISLESIVQRQSATDQPEATKTVILVTHETTEAAVKKALEGIVKDGHATDKPQMIRIERAG